MHKLIRPAFPLGLAALALAIGPAPWFPAPDPTWCAPDPYDEATNPRPGDPLHMGEIEVPIPAEFDGWIAHTHREGRYYFCASSFALGDLEGPDDGDLDIAIATSQEAVLVARLEFDRNGRTGELTPLWFWLSPWARSTLFDPAQPSTPLAHGGGPERNVLIWDFDEDGRNEVAVLSANYQGADTLFVLGEPAPGSISPTFSVPEPVEFGKEATGVKTDGQTPRLGICRVRDTDGPRDICMHSHKGESLTIWRYAPPAPETAPALQRIYDAYIFAGGTSTRNAGGVKTHEFNYADVDGDGYDEFFLDGVLDLVDRVGGVATPTYGGRGVMRWRTGYPPSAGHMDQMIAADWNPAHEGLEILAVTEGPWNGPISFSGPSHPTFHASNRDVMFSATGEVLRENLDAPSTDGQSIFGGNFTATRDGLEAIFTPKDFTGVVVPRCQPLGSGSYTIDARQNELAMNGVSFLRRIPEQDCHNCCPADPTYPYNDNPPPTRSTGPGWSDLTQLDWDGDVREDEVLSYTGKSVLVWRLGQKGDSRSGSPQLPRLDQLLDGTKVVPAFYFENRPYYIHYYTGSVLGELHPEWAWQNGGPGRYTHYFEKLASVYPHADLISLSPWDVVRDHREEILVLHRGALSIFFNRDALEADPELPRLLYPEYRRWRMERIHYPFRYQGLPGIASLELRPADPALPSRVVGMWTDSRLQLQALAHFDDGRKVDVTRLVRWIGDPDSNPFLPVSRSGEVISDRWRVSARIRAELTLAERTLESNPLLVLATDRPEAVILSAGYGETFLDQGNPSLPLEVEAQVAQRDNVRPLYVPIVHPDGSYFQPHGETIWLLDDGSPAHGDDLARDGIFSARIVPSPQVESGIDLGDNLLAVRASYYVGPSDGDFLRSRLWPYVTLGTGSEPLDFPVPGPTDDLTAFQGPRILSCGTRGVDSFPRHLFLEARVAVPSVGTTRVSAHLPVLGIEVALQPRGDGFYVLDFDPGFPVDRTVLVHVRATTDFHGAYASDYWPRLRLHDVLTDD